jgi:hypothetical protein
MGYVFSWVLLKSYDGDRFPMDNSAALSRGRPIRLATLKQATRPTPPASEVVPVGLDIAVCAACPAGIESFPFTTSNFNALRRVFFCPETAP